MERHDLNRIFDQLSPTPEQEKAVLSGLLTERKDRPMKNMKKMTAILAAAVLAAGVCTAAAVTVATGMDQRLLDYFGAGPEQEEQLSSAAATEEPAAHTYENGWTVEISQVLSDRYIVAAVLDFTAPEGMTLPVPEGMEAEREFTLMVDYRIEDKDGNLIGSLNDAPLPEPAGYDSETGRPVYDHWDRETEGDGLANCEYLDSSDPEHGRLSVVWRYVRGSQEEGFALEELLGAQVSIIPKGLTCNSTRETVYFTGEEEIWSYDVTLSDTDSGQVQTIEMPLQIGAYKVQLKQVYFSPLELVYEFQTAPGTGSDYGLPLYDKENRGYAINLADGSAVCVKDAFDHFARALADGGGINHIGLYPVQFIDPEEVVSFTLFGQTIPLK